jgi:hypothetical protein
LNTFARFDGELALPREVDRFAMRVDANDFTLRRAGVVLGFALRAVDGGTLDPGIIDVQAARSALFALDDSVLLRRRDTAGDLSSLTLARVGAAAR